MFYFKACTKCRGDLTLENDAYGDFLKCMQCGTLIDVEVEDSSRRSLLIESRDRALSGAQAKTAVAA
jgi:PHP family Zn ribbon phosphoesterase